MTQGTRPSKMHEHQEFHWLKSERASSMVIGQWMSAQQKWAVTGERDWLTPEVLYARGWDYHGPAAPNMLHQTVTGQTMPLSAAMALQKARELIGGLCCVTCKAQGADMALPGKCCRDEDCDAGWSGVHCDEVAVALAMIDNALGARLGGSAQKPPYGLGEGTVPPWSPPGVEEERQERCCWTYRSPQCGYKGPILSCEKTIRSCQSHDNAQHFGVSLMSTDEVDAWLRSLTLSFVVDEYDPGPPVTLRACRSCGSFEMRPDEFIWCGTCGKRYRG